MSSTVPAVPPTPDKPESAPDVVRAPVTPVRRSLPPGFRWVDFPEQGWLASPWDFSHTLALGFALFFYLFPGIIFIIAKLRARAVYLSRFEAAKANVDSAFYCTGCALLAPVLHLGGHPMLPYGQRVVIGLSGE